MIRNVINVGTINYSAIKLLRMSPLQVDYKITPQVVALFLDHFQSHYLSLVLLELICFCPLDWIYLCNFSGL